MAITATKPPHAPASAHAIGFWTAVSIVMGNMIGSGVFLLPASLAPFGGISLAGWSVSIAGSVCLALVFAQLARMRPAAGGLYAYTRDAFGDVPAFLVAWGYWISTCSALAALAVAGVGYLDPFFPAVVRSPVGAPLLAIGIMWTMVAVNARGVRAAGHVQFATTALKILPLLAVGVAGLAYFHPAYLAVTGTSPRAMVSDVTQSATLTLWAFLGVECATIPAGSIRDPERTIPRATIAGTLITAGIYVISTVGVMGVVPPATLASTTAPFAEAARLLAGDHAARLIALGAAISCFGALNGWTLIVGQLPMAVAQDGLFPRVFARLSTRGTPVAAFAIGAAVATVLVAANYGRGLVKLFTFFILLSTLSTLIPYAFCSLAAFMTERRSPRHRLTAGARAVCALAFVYSMWAIAGAGTDVVTYGFLLLLAGLPIYVWVARK
jgi:APA family basic amino acid/polyamine antiporter